MTELSAAPASSARPAAGGRAAYVPFGALRLGLALLVLLQHAASHVAPDWVRLAIAPYEVGSTAVFVFFALSGFVIADATDLVYESRPVAFLANRLLRIVPTYVVALAVFAGLGAVAFAVGARELWADGRPLLPADLAAPGVLAANLLAIVPGLSSLAGGDTPVAIPIVWAVRVELTFYAAWFALMVAARLTGVAFGRILFVAALAILALSAVAFERTAGSTFANAPFFVLGVAIHRILTRTATQDRASILAMPLAGAALDLCIHRIADLPLVIAGTDLWRNTPAEIALFGSLLALFFGLALVRLPGRSPLSRLDRRLGELTYPLYVNHLTVVTVAAALVPSPTPASFAVVLLAATVFPILVALPTEPLIARLRDRVRGRRLG